MADNVNITPGTGATVAADDIGGVLHQRVKISQGADGSATDVSSAAPLQVTLANTGANTNKILTTPDLPSGASTAANQSTIIGHLDGVEGTLTTIDADTGNISTKIDTVAGAVSGTEMQVDVVAPLPAGTNNIGDVDVLSLPSLPAGTNNIGDVDVLSQPARLRTANSVSAAQATDSIMDNLTALTPKFAVINATASGNTTVVAAVTSRKIRVLNYTFVCSAAVEVKFRSSTAGDITGAMPCATNSGVAAPHAVHGLFETTAGEALQINLSTTANVRGHLSYIEV